MLLEQKIILCHLLYRVLTNMMKFIARNVDCQFQLIFSIVVFNPRGSSIGDADIALLQTRFNVWSVTDYKTIPNFSNNIPICFIATLSIEIEGRLSGKIS